MEYLMTYGWSILIIAIVLAALFSLGVFSNSNLGPRAQANSCRVYRPNGPGTTTNINLEGVCNGELPEYVAQFNGASSYVSTGLSGLPGGSAARSVFLWFNIASLPSVTGNPMMYSYGTSATNNAFSLMVVSGSCNAVYFSGWADDFCATPLVISPNTWYFMGVTYSAGASTATVYLDSQSYVGTIPHGALTTLVAGSKIGDAATSGGAVYYFNGMIADVQVYNASLDANAVQALYLEGIGGAPVEPQNLIGWWPLNGDTNDYGGNNNNGAQTSVTFTGSWTSGYTPP